MPKMWAIKNKGFLTVEMTIIMPLILMVIFLVIWLFLFLFEKEKLRCDEYREIYSVPWEILREKKEEEFINSVDFSEGHLYGSVDVKNDMSNDTFRIEGRVAVKYESDCTVIRDVGLVSDRLRRWQFYGNLANKQRNE
ncbi:MAG: pilus assembly protein [Eubacterium sp.]|nr:pilus assembly protein [Eubacterium sp.]